MRLLEDYLVKKGFEVECTREPGGTVLAEAIRSLLLEPRYGPVEARTEILLYAAARAQHVSQRILPALKGNKIVICDRFIDSSIAYQGYGRGLGIELVRQVNTLATGGLVPDLTILIDVPVEVGMLRCRKETSADRLEQEDIMFHRRVRRGYLEIAKLEAYRVFLVEGTGLPETVWFQVQKKIDSVLKIT